MAAAATTTVATVATAAAVAAVAAVVRSADALASHGHHLDRDGRELACTHGVPLLSFWNESLVELKHMRLGK